MRTTIPTRCRKTGGLPPSHQAQPENSLFRPMNSLDCTPRVRHQNQGQVAIGVWFAAAPDPGWWFDSAQQAASERAPHSAVASERLAVVVAPCAASCERWLASNSIGD